MSGGLADPAMARVVAHARVPWILMHWRGHSDRMGALATYDDVLAEVRAELVARVDAAVLAGVDPGRIVLDPGLGFAKTAEHNWALLRRLDVLLALGFPVLVGRLAQAVPRRSCWPATTARHARRRAARWPRPRSPRWWPRRGRGASGCTTSPRRWTPSRWTSAIQLGAAPALDKPGSES